jgi:hypothetical protein
VPGTGVTTRGRIRRATLTSVRGLIWLPTLAPTEANVGRRPTTRPCYARRSCRGAVPWLTLLHGVARVCMAEGALLESCGRHRSQPRCLGHGKRESNPRSQLDTRLDRYHQVWGDRPDVGSHLTGQAGHDRRHRWTAKPMVRSHTWDRARRTGAQALRVRGQTASSPHSPRSARWAG